jgi:uncharacterized membrane protein YadS
VALLAGIALALCGLSACAKGRKTASKRLIQACVVELGLRIDLSVVTHSGNVATMAQSHSTQRRIGRKAIISMVHLRRSGCQRSANFCPQLKSIELAAMLASGLGFQLALFLIGSGLSRESIEKVGWRAFVQATVLWITVAAAFRCYLLGSGLVSMLSD